MIAGDSGSACVEGAGPLMQVWVSGFGGGGHIEEILAVLSRGCSSSA